MRKLSSPADIRLADAELERVRRSMTESIRELQSVPGAQVELLSDVSLASAVNTPVAHKLGRKPKMIRLSPPRGAVSTGRIEEVRSSSYDRSEVVVLLATGWGATITVDVEVY